MLSSKGSYWPRGQTCMSYSSYLAGRFFHCWATREAVSVLKKVTKAYYMLSEMGFPVLSLLFYNIWPSCQCPNILLIVCSKIIFCCSLYFTSPSSVDVPQPLTWVFLPFLSLCAFFAIVEIVYSLSKMEWIQIPCLLPLISTIILSKFSHMKNETNNTDFNDWIWGLKEIMPIKGWQEWTFSAFSFASFPSMPSFPIPLQCPLSPFPFLISNF